jgi:bacterioferritin-associated ferredoxin
MFVCHCHVVTDRDIIESIANGARCIADLARATGAGRACGGCVATIRDLVSGPERPPVESRPDGIRLRDDVRARPHGGPILRSGRPSGTGTPVRR